MTEKKEILEKKVDALQKSVTVLSQAILELSQNIPDAIIKSTLESTKGMILVSKINEKYNAKLRKIDINFAKQVFYILVCFIFYVLILIA